MFKTNAYFNIFLIFLIFMNLNFVFSKDKVLLPLIDYRNVSSNIFKTVNAKMKKLPDMDKKKFPDTENVYKFIFPKITPEYAKKYAKDKFNLDGKVRVTGYESDFTRVWGTKKDFVLNLYTHTGNFRFENYQYDYEPEKWKTDNKICDDNFYIEKAINYLKKYKIYNESLNVLTPRIEKQEWGENIEMNIFFYYTINNYSLIQAYIIVSMSTEGKLILIYNKFAPSESIGKYPLININDAYEKLLSGKGTFNGYLCNTSMSGKSDKLDLGEVRNVKIVYFYSPLYDVKPNEQYALPFYRFEFVCGPDGMTYWGRKLPDVNIIYGYYPAVKEEYLKK